VTTFTVPPPLGGDPATITLFATKYGKIAAALVSAADELRSLANSDVSVGKSITAVKERALGAQSDTLKVAAHYSGASSTYATYAVSLRDAQQKAQSARQMILGFEADAMRHQQHHDSLVAEAQTGLASQETADALNLANSQLATFKSDYANAMSVYAGAVEDKRVAVQTAISQLADAAQVAGLVDSVFDVIKEGLHDLYQLAQKYLAPLLVKIRAVLKLIQAVLDTLSFIASFIPIPIVKVVLAAAALAVSSLALQCSIVLFLLGKGTASQIIGDAIDMATSVLAVVTPAAKVVGSLMKGALEDAGKDAVKSVATNVLGTDMDSALALTATLPDPFVDSTAPPWGESPVAGEQTVGSSDFKDELVRDFYKGLPGVNIISAYQDNIVPAFSGTGS